MTDELDPMSSLAAKQADQEAQLKDMLQKMDALIAQNTQLMQTNAKLMQAQASQPAPAETGQTTEAERMAEVHKLAFSSFKRELNIKD